MSRDTLELVSCETFSPLKIGYARVSRDEQTLDLQTDALEKAGCSRIYTDKASGAKQSRPGLDKALEQLRLGDTLIVWRLDRLGRSLKHLIEVVEDLNAKGIRHLQKIN